MAAASSRCRKHPNAEQLGNTRLTSLGGLRVCMQHCTASCSWWSFKPLAALFRARALISFARSVCQRAVTRACCTRRRPGTASEQHGPCLCVQIADIVFVAAAMLEHVTLLQRQDECMDQSYNAHEENESRRLCSPAVSTAAWTTRLRLSPIKALRGDEERDRARAREGGREREHFIQEGNRAPVLETTHSRNWATRGFAC